MGLESHVTADDQASTAARSVVRRRSNTPAALAALKRQIQLLDGTAALRLEPDPATLRAPTLSERSAFWQFSVAEVDQALGPAGLKLCGVHEVVPDAQDDMAAAHGFILALLQQYPLHTADTHNAASHNTGTVDVDGMRASPAARSRAPILYCQSHAVAREFGVLSGAGLTAFGWQREQFVLAASIRDGDTLWAMEEGARSGALRAVIGSVGRASFKQTQRLNRAGLEGGVPVFLLRLPGSQAPGAVMSRWRIRRVPGHSDAYDAQAPGRLAWRINLDRCRGGRRGTWCLEWSHETYRFDLVPPFSTR
ncbi:MAG: hypothetical protein K0U34_03440 [Alphaproteobacteria bacterium]|nr:hypothetical protein [Alphaproteobacteria bacterium]